MFTVGTRVAMVIESAIAQTTFRFEGTVMDVQTEIDKETGSAERFIFVQWDNDSAWYGENSRAFRTIQPA